MSGDASTFSVADFVAAAQRAGLLPADSATVLTQASSARQVPPGQLAVQTGLLTHAQVEIVETLLNPTQAIAGYEILGLLGAGGMGVVYRARQLSLGRIVALKTVMLGGQTSVSRLNRFEQEAQTVGKLLHPHIITAYDFGQHGGRLYFAMELVDGEDVERRIVRDGPFSEALTWGLIRQAAAGLAMATEFGVVHRDIKPANLLLVTPPTGYPLPPGMPMVKIADFGLARITHEVDDRTRLTADNSAVGSPHYMAPEQLESGEIDVRADLYALGATAYHMLAGRPPFDGLTLPQIFSRKVNGAPDPLKNDRADLSPDTLALVQELMARERTERIADCAELIRRIDRLQPSTRATPAPSSSPTRSIATDTRRMLDQTDSQWDAPKRMPSRAESTPRGGSLRRMDWRIILAVVLIAGAAYAVSMYWQPRNETSGPAVADLRATGLAEELFDGQSMHPWKTRSGNWHLATDDEGARVLAASHGQIARPLPRTSHYRLRFNAALRKATAIELAFGIAAAESGQETHFVLHLEREQARLGRHPATDDFKTSSVALSLDPDRYHEVRIERQAQQWRAYVDDRLVGTAPLARQEAPLFLISVVSPGGDEEAYFADFVVEELAAP